MLYAGTHLPGIHLFAYLIVHTFQYELYTSGHFFPFGSEEYQFIPPVAGIFLPDNPVFLFQVVDQVGKAGLVFRCFLGQGLLADSLFFPPSVHNLQHFESHVDIILFEQPLDALAEGHPCF